MGKAETIDLYLLRLGVALSRRFPNDESRVLRILSETEDHLRQAVEKNRDAGLAPSEAEREAIRQFGSPETVAERFGRELGGALSPLGLFVRSYPHLGALVGPLVAAAGAVCLVMSGLAAVFGPVDVFGMEDPPPSYFLPQCESMTPQEMALRVCTTEEPWVPQPAVSHLWLTVGGAAALAAGAALWGAHRALLRRHVGCWEDQSLPARVHAMLGTLFFGLAGLLLWPIFVATGPFDYFVDFEETIDLWLAAGALVTAVFFLAYVRYARSVYALRA